MLKQISNFTTSILAVIFIISGCSKKEAADPAEILPVVTTAAASSITRVSAVSGGSVTLTGSDSITSRGIYFGESINPRPSGGTKVAAGKGTGTFTCNITGLIPSKTYHVRAFAITSTDTTFGTDVTFTTLAAPTPSTFTYNGKTYNSVLIGSQLWIKQNLATDKYANGDAITTGLDNNAWNSINEGAFSVFEDNPSNKTNYGNLYNYYAVVDPRGLCPTGFHIPTNAEYDVLNKFATTSATSFDGGAKLKAVSTLWRESSFGGNSDTYGFSALPGGYRGTFGDYFQESREAYLWAKSEVSGADGFGWYLNFDSKLFSKDDMGYQNGVSVRCIHD